MSDARSSEAHAVIAGSGVAALEALIALRDLAAPGLRITLVSPEETFEFPAVAAMAELGLTTSAPRALRELTDRFGAELVHGRLLQVHAQAGDVWLDRGRRVDFDALLVAVGCRSTAPHPHALTLGMPGSYEA